MNIKFINEGTPHLIFDNVNNYEKYSIHIWKRSPYYKNDAIRVHMSGWISDKLYTFSVSEPGVYFANILFPNKSLEKTESVQISLEELFLITDFKETKTLSNLMMDRSQIWYDTQVLLQKMFIVGSDKILSVLHEYLDKTKTLSIFASEETLPISNAIFSMSFFKDEMSTPLFYSDKTINHGYLFSMTFRSGFKPAKTAKFNKNDVLLIMDQVDSSAKSIIVSNAQKSGAKVINIIDLITEAYIEKFLIDPLNKLSNVTYYVNLPTAKKIKNPTITEGKAANITIKSIRNNLKDKVYPDALKEFNSEYIIDVLNGWSLDKNAGYDTLVDSKSEYVNIVDGHRIIPQNGHQFNENNGRVLFFGNSVIYGIGSDDQNTIPSLFTQKTDVYSENRANFSMNDFVRATNFMSHFEFNEDDIVVMGVHLPLSSRLQKKLDNYIDVQPYFDHPRMIEKDVFIDMTHMNKYGYEIIAQVLSDKINIK